LIHASGLSEAIKGGYLKHEVDIVNVYAETNFVLEMALQQGF